MENYKACQLPQEAASAWSVLDGLVGASYKPLVYVGKQVVNGTLYWFVAEQTLITYPTIRRVIKLAIKHQDEEYSLLASSIEEII